MLFKGSKKKSEKKQMMTAELNQCYTENMDINRLYKMVETNKKLAPSQMYAVNDVKKMR